MSSASDTGRFGHAFDRLLHARLPLPLARLYARGSNAVSARNRLLSAYYLHEATLKLSVSIEVMRMLERPWHDPKLDRALELLALPSIGVWTSLLPVLAAEDFEASGPAKVLSEKSKQIPAVARAIEILSFGTVQRRSPVAPVELFQNLETFRNRLITGDELPEAVECAAMAETLLDAFAQIVTQTTILDHFSLAVVEARSEVSNKLAQIKWFDLTGPTPVRSKPDRIPPDPAFQPGRAFAKTPEGNWLALHPLVLFREDEFLPELLFIEGSDPERGILYLDYVTGRVDDSDVDLDKHGLRQSEVEVMSLIERARKKPLTVDDFRECVRRSAEKFPAGSLASSSKAKTFGEYRLLGELGRGGMGIVYLARQQTVGRFVALKLFPPALAADPVASARFEREIAALGRCDHPNVVKVIAAGKADRTSYYAMELVSGTTLAGLVHSPETHSLAEAISIASAKDREKFEGLPDLPAVATPPAPRTPSRRNAHREIAEMMAQAARGVHHLHEHGILHRDLKPANLMVSAEDQRVVVMDLGLAAVEGTSVTQDQDSVLGTLRYMAPEQLLRSASEVDRRSDVYSLGATLYELVTSVPMHDGDTQARIIQQVLHEEPKRASAINHEIPADLDAILLRCLSKNANERYPTAMDFANDLQCFADGEPVSARVPTAAEQLKRLAAKYRTYILLVAAALIAIVSLGVVSFIKISQERRDVLRLSDLESLERLETLEQGLWPAFPANVPRMETWLAQAEALTARIDMHRTRLEDLKRRPEARAANDTAGNVATIETKEALERERDDIKAQLDEKQSKGIPADLLLALSLRRKEIAETLAAFDRAGGTRTRDFARDEDQWWHDTLERLVADLTEFRDTTMPSVRARIGEAKAIGERMAKYRDTWNEAIDRVASSEHYSGIRIQPQTGFVPIGRDPASGLEEFAHFPSGTVPERGADGRLVIDEESCLVFVLLPGRSFVMGAENPGRIEPDPNDAGGGGSANPTPRADVKDNIDEYADATEGPCHEVTLAPFFLSKYEMSQAQWIRLAGANPSTYHPDAKIGGIKITLLHPAESVSWIESRDLLSRLALDLPTEAQWEYAARAGTTTIWFTGDEKESLSGACNVADRRAKAAGIIQGLEFDEWLSDGYILHAPIGRFEPNAFGLHDTHGNVWEWCRDAYGSYQLPWNPGDGERLVFGSETHVARGGHFLRNVTYARCSNRDYQLPNSGHGGLGVRPARALER